MYAGMFLPRQQYSCPQVAQALRAKSHSWADVGRQEGTLTLVIGASGSGEVFYELKLSALPVSQG